jgi:DNA polymerase I - 3''-5'' exonuclease and polymerase domains
MLQVFYEMEMPVLNVISLMELQSILVDRQQCRDISAALNVMFYPTVILKPALRPLNCFLPQPCFAHPHFCFLGAVKLVHLYSAVV